MGEWTVGLPVLASADAVVGGAGSGVKGSVSPLGWSHGVGSGLSTFARGSKFFGWEGGLFTPRRGGRFSMLGESFLVNK